MSRTAIVMLTWNRLDTLKNTINTFKKYNKKVNDEDIIIVDNGSKDKTDEFLKNSNYDYILNKINYGAQLGKHIGWDRAVNRKFDFIMFIEDDHPCYRNIPIQHLEKYLDEHEEIGIIRLNDKNYLKRHQITKLPIDYFTTEKLNSNFDIKIYNYHFTSHPSIFRTSLVEKLKGCVYPLVKPKNINIEKLGFEKYKGTPKYELAKERVLMDFGVREKEYMRLYLLHYNFTAQLTPACFKWVDKKRMNGWKN